MNANATLNNQYTLQFPFCARVGGIAGAIVGLIFGLVQLHLDPAIVFTMGELVGIGVLIGLLSWIDVLIIVGLWLRYGIRAVALLGLIISVVVGIVTVITLDVIGVAPLGMLLGWMIGTLVGALLCWVLCGKRQTLSSRPTQGGAPDARG